MHVAAFRDVPPREVSRCNRDWKVEKEDRPPTEGNHNPASENGPKRACKSARGCPGADVATSPLATERGA